MRWFRVGFALVAAFVSVVTLATQGQEQVIPSDRVSSFVYVRSAPDGQSAEKSRLQIGESLPLVRSVPRWYEVLLPDGTTGFVSKAWTKVTHPMASRAQDELRIHFVNIGTASGM